jgi:hypothetical protein
MSLLSSLKDVSIIIASITAIYGIDSWRREFQGKRHIELAEEVLSLFYEAKDAITSIRWFYSVGEGTTRDRNENETEEQRDALDKAYVVWERYQRYEKLFNKIDSIKYRYQVMFAQYDPDALPPFTELRGILKEIIMAANQLSQLWVRSHGVFVDDEQEKRHFDNVEKYEGIIWLGLAEKDPINPRMEQIISQIETTCCKIIIESGMSLPDRYGPKIRNLFNEWKNYLKI